LFFFFSLIIFFALTRALIKLLLVSIYSIRFLTFSSFLFFSYNFCFSSAIVSLISLYVFTIKAIIIKTAAIKTTVSSRSFKYISLLRAKINFNKLSFFDHFFLFSIIFCWNISFSQQKSTTSTITLSEVVINSLKNITDYSLTPFSVTKINFENQQQLKQQNSFNEYLNNVPSIFALNANNFAQDLRVSIRGFGSRAAFGIRGIKIIVDGIPETTPDGQGQIDNLPLSLIKNIEILRGSSSSLYGNASGGVIFISTLDSLKGGSPRFRSTIGSYGMKMLSFDVQLRGKKTLALLHQNFLKINGFRDHSKLSQRIFNLKVRHKFSQKTKLDWQLNLTNSPLAQDPGSLNIESVKNNRKSFRQKNKDYDAGEKINHFKTGLNLKTSLRNNLVLNNYIFYSKRDFNGKLSFKNGGIIDLQRNYYGFGSSLDFSKEKNQFKYKAKFGIEYLSQEDQRDRYENNFGEKGLITFSQLEFFKNFGTYFLLNLKHNNLFLQSGLRYDNQNIGTNDIGNAIYYSSINPSIGVSYLVGQKNRIFANFSTSFESPSLSELSSNPSAEEGLNKELNPSKAKNYEIGWKFFGTNIIVETTLFYIKSSNELLPYELEEFPGRAFYRNAGLTNRTGVEMSYKRSWKKFNMIRSLSYAKYIFDDYIKKGEDLSGKNIPGIPSMTRNLELNYNNNGWKVQFNYNNIGKFYAEDENKIKIDSYSILNVQSSKTFYKGWGEILISGGVKNILNKEYYDNIRINAFGGRYYEAAPGRNFFTSLIVKL